MFYLCVLSRALAAILFNGLEPFVQFGSGYYEQESCEIILNLDKWFRRRFRLKDFLSWALAALLFSGAEPFMQFWKRASWGTFMWSYMKLGPVVQEEMSFKEKVNSSTKRTPPPLPPLKSGPPLTKNFWIRPWALSWDITQKVWLLSCAHYFLLLIWDGQRDRQTSGGRQSNNNEV